MKVGIVGSRRRDSEGDFALVEAAFLRLHRRGVTIVSGGCPRGGDEFAERIARRMKVPIRIHKAEWDKHGIAAGFIRNNTVARESDALIACVAADRRGGTEDTIRKFQKYHPEGLLILV